jgi:hypothetical protein
VPKSILKPHPHRWGFSHIQGEAAVIDPDALVTGPDAVAWFANTPTPLSASTFRSWVHRGYSDVVRDEHGQIVLDEDGKPTRVRRKLEAVDRNGPRRRPRYRWSDVADAERATRRNPKSPGRGRPNARELVPA